MEAKTIDDYDDRAPDAHKKRNKRKEKELEKEQRAELMKMGSSKRSTAIGLKAQDPNRAQL